MKSCPLVLLFLCLVSACYNHRPETSEAWNLSEEQQDSVSFYTSHHYTEGFNFVVRADSLPLIAQHPLEAVNGLMVDTLTVRRGDHLVVADILTTPDDTIDTVWVKVARDQATFGWVHESHLLPYVSPDDPISLFIERFSDTHLLLFLGLLAIAGSAYLLRRLLRKGAKMVLVRDIQSFYPTFLVVMVAVAAVVYGTIQTFAPDQWRHYYYHPTLNPFAVPLLLGVFLTTVWAMLIAAVAAFDDVRRQLEADEALVYLLSLGAVCASAYVVFSVTTLYYIGYPLLLGFIWAVLHHYFHSVRCRYKCGRCGHALQEKGICPHCGALNQ